MTSFDWRALVDRIVDEAVMNKPVTSRENGAYISLFEGLLITKDKELGSEATLMRLVLSHLKKEDAYPAQFPSNESGSFDSFLVSRAALLCSVLPSDLNASDLINAICISLAESDYRTAVDGLLLLSVSRSQFDSTNKVEQRFIHQAVAFLENTFDVIDDTYGALTLTWLHTFPTLRAA